MAESVDANTRNAVVFLTATHILQYLYCPRFTYFEEVLKIPERQEKRFKVKKGREVHDTIRTRNPNYLRKKIGAIRKLSDVYISASNMRGIVDEVLFLNDGTAAPLDYKYAEFKDRTFKNHQFQLTFYGKLIEQHFGMHVKKGFIVYSRSNNKLVEVPITEHMFAELQTISDFIAKIIVQGYYPPPTSYRARCSDCCYRNLCGQVV